MTDKPSEEAVAAHGKLMGSYCPHVPTKWHAINCRLCVQLALDEFRAAGETLVFNNMAEAKDAAHQDWEDRFAALERERDELREQLADSQTDCVRRLKELSDRLAAAQEDSVWAWVAKLNQRAGGDCLSMHRTWLMTRLRELVVAARNQEGTEQ